MRRQKDNPLADEQQVRATLYYYAVRAIPSDLDLTAAVHQHLSTRRRVRRNTAALLSLTLASYLLILLLPGWTGNLPLLTQRAITATVSQLPTPLDPVLLRFGREVNLSQSSGGQTVTLWRVYADQQVVVVAYKVVPQQAAPSRCPDPDFCPRRYVMPDPTLSDERGTILPAINTLAWAERGSDSTWVVSYFAADGLAWRGLDADLHLDLTVQPTQRTINSLDAPLVRLALPTTASGLTASFSYRLPVSRDLVHQQQIAVNQTQRVGTVYVTLQEVRYSPAQVQAVLRIDGADGQPFIAWEGSNWATSRSSNYAAGRNNLQLAGETLIQQADGTWLYSVTGNLAARAGLAHLVIYHLEGSNLATPGPWLFNLTIPDGL